MNVWIIELMNSADWGAPRWETERDFPSSIARVRSAILAIQWCLHQIHQRNLPRIFFIQMRVRLRDINFSPQTQPCLHKSSSYIKPGVISVLFLHDRSSIRSERTMHMQHVQQNLIFALFLTLKDSILLKWIRACLLHVMLLDIHMKLGKSIICIGLTPPFTGCCRYCTSGDAL